MRGTVRALRAGSGSAKLAHTQNPMEWPLDEAPCPIRHSSERVAACWLSPWHGQGHQIIVIVAVLMPYSPFEPPKLAPFPNSAGGSQRPEGGAASDCLLHCCRDACGGRPGQRQRSLSRLTAFVPCYYVCRGFALKYLARRSNPEVMPEIPALSAACLS